MDDRLPCRRIAAGALDIAYATQGDPRGWPVVLLHGFPYGIEAYADAGRLLAAKGAYVILP